MGRDPAGTSLFPCLSYFNPRAPHGARLVPCALDRCVGYISIHAPRMGRDSGLSSAVISPPVFQSTRPAWGATALELLHFNVQPVFQSTRPAWGATAYFGCSSGGEYKFQSTRPAWGATLRTSGCARAPGISIHAPRMGRDVQIAHGFACRFCISIHAPRMGRDITLIRCPAPYIHFNPRAPHGARPRVILWLVSASRFQSTRPAWGATALGGCLRR